MDGDGGSQRNLDPPACAATGNGQLDKAAPPVPEQAWGGFKVNVEKTEESAAMTGEEPNGRRPAIPHAVMRAAPLQENAARAAIPGGTPLSATPGGATRRDRPSRNGRAAAERIERTREELGATVEALAAKADPKARAWYKAADVSVRLTGTARQVKGQISLRAWKIRRELADMMLAASQPVLNTAGPVRYQVTARVGHAGAAVWAAAPEPVRRAAKRAADSAGQRRIPLTVAVSAPLLVGWMIVRWQR